MASDGKSSDPHARRESGARMQVSEPIILSGRDDDIHGWTLNISRGGLRAIVDEPLIVGDRYQVAVGEGGQPRAGRVVWVKPDKGGGCIFGFSFDDSTSAPPPPPATNPPAGPPVPGVPIAPRIPDDDSSDS